MHRLSLGASELTVLEDGTWDFAASAFFANAHESEWRPDVGAAADAAGRIPVGHNCCLVASADELILVDTGCGADTHAGATGHLLEDLARAGYRPEDVTCVVNTHAHGDHIKGNTRLRDGVRVPTFPNARYVLGRRDWQRFCGPAGTVHEFDEHIASLAKRGVLMLVEGCEQLAPDVRLLPTPGHTPGHVSVLVETRRGTVIFLGDVCHHAAHVRHPEWISELDTDPHKTPRTRAALFELAAELEATVILPHAPPPALGRIERSGRSYRWHPLG